ncbi:MmgE/PrpD family protein [Paraburkholderia sp. SOS3]|jgi:2-methylcitrate dehydratase PrpD|uniref:MmgE/PrpD family protein n=1 Tax=Paraburkholderia sp. SOS3 TaxID=1926494 RepID=UPI0009477E78|nr:MmgE/PrpD family protein [Paraburkholderia sp. SOS3]APR36858.1 MmgE/PrpD family protein [Paraburkholderia sp. SOS3]
MQPRTTSAEEPLAPTRQLAQFVERTRWSDIPDAVRHEAKRSLVNYFAVAFAGCADPSIEQAVSVYRRYRAGCDASLIGRAERTDSLNAATLNAMTANVHDFDDTHLPTIIHPSAPVAAPLFALGESTSMSTTMSGETLLLAFVLGVEIECRIGNAVSPSHYQRGWHITSTCGVFGAAAAAAKVLNLDAGQTAHALGHASAQAGGLVETLGTMAKSVSVGNAARNGVLSALLAGEGLSGPAQPIEGERGFVRVCSDQPDFDALTAQLGSRWALQANTYKPYPCGVVLNPVIEACLDLARGKQWSLADIERVELLGHPLLRERTDRPGIRSGREAQVSAQHSVAVTLSTGRAGLAEFSDESAANPDVRAFAGRVAFVDDSRLPVEAARVTVLLRSGESVSRTVSAARGSLAVPLSDAELDTKLKELAAYGAPHVDTQRLLDTLWTLDTAADATLPMHIARTESG